ncbi:MAG: hypothetical protein FWD88_07645, partial [Treponema sp.]|nr:hypothetical protein [Treponema sp.]
MASKRAGTAKRHIVANTAAVTMVVFLGVVSALDIMGHYVTIAEGTLLAAIPTALLLLIFAFKAVNDFSKLAFFVPLVLFVLSTMVLTMDMRHAYFFYLLACFFICGISCLYTSFFRTMAYVLLQAAVIAGFSFLDFSDVGHDVSLIGLIGIYSIFLFCCLFLLVVTKTATVDLQKLSGDADSFKTYLSTTRNYLAMLDGSNRVVYVSKPLSDLAHIENPELTKGRP